MQPYPHQYPPRRPEFNAATMVAVLFVLFLFLVLPILGGLYLARYWSGGAVHAEPREVTPRGDLMEIEKTQIAIYKKAGPSVVHITSLVNRVGATRLNVQQVPEGTGSGFVWDKDGNIVTNFHVIRGASAARVTLADGSEYSAKLVGGAPDKDLAVLNIGKMDKLVPLDIGTSHDLQVGQAVFAIGNPFGLDRTLTTGIVSALNREIETSREGQQTIRNAIQTDAAINPGNSGGPLLDSACRLIGVNTAIYSPSGSSAGIGFAIPVDEVNRVVPDLIAHGEVRRPSLGVVVANDQTARQLGIEGVLIVEVRPDSPAAKAGLQPTVRLKNGDLRLGDVITAIDGKEVKRTKDLFALIENHKKGDKVKIEFLRDEKKQTVEVTLDAAS
jgi:S1-C subfamily serine protease